MPATPATHWSYFWFYFCAFQFLFQSTNDQKEKQLRDLTQLCLAIGILFLVCESPRTILPIYHRFIDRSLASRIIANISYLLTAFDHSMNFFIYVLRGERFRQDLFEILPWCQKLFKDKRGNDLHLASSRRCVSQTQVSEVSSPTEIEMESSNRHWIHKIFILGKQLWLIFTWITQNVFNFLFRRKVLNCFS